MLLLTKRTKEAPDFEIISFIIAVLDDQIISYTKDFEYEQEEFEIDCDRLHDSYLFYYGKSWYVVAVQP